MTPLHRFKDMYNKVPGPLRSRYALVVYAFLIWMLFFDAFNAVYRWQIFSELRDARQQQAYYEEETALIRADLEELFTDGATLEKFAREKYFMKKPDEDLFVIIEE